MKSFKVSRTISMNHTRAQVTVVLVVDGQKVSSTRHAQLKGGDWIGLNPDPRAKGLNQAAEDLVNLHGAQAASIAGSLEFARKVADEGVPAGTKPSAFRGLVDPTHAASLFLSGRENELKELVARRIPHLEESLAIARADLAVAQSVLGDTQAEYPLIVRFDGVK